MNGQQYVEERFGFKAKGEFRCKGWFEVPLTVVGLALVIPGALGIFDFLFNHTFGGGRPAIPFVIVAWAMFCWWIVRIAHTGVTYRYEADDKEFRIYEPKGHTEILYYPDITSVGYDPMYYLNGKVRGYVVTITTKYRILTYSYIFSGNRLYKTPEGSPFYIIEERAGLVKGIVPEGGAVRSGEESHGERY